MNMLRRLLVTAAGHDARTLADYARSQVAPIVASGGLTVLACAVAGVSAGIAGWSFMGGALDAQALCVGVAAGLAATLVVFVIDRAFLASMDAQPDMGWLVLPALAMRIALVAGVSSLSSAAVTQVVLQQELRAHALAMRENAESGRVARLKQQFDVAALAAEEDRRAALAEAAKAALAATPAEVRTLQGRAAACQNALGRQRRQLREEGFGPQAVAARTRVQAERCSAIVSAAQRALDAHRREAGAQLANAEQRSAEAETALREARRLVSQRTTDAGGVEAAAVTWTSSSVLRSLLASDTGAWVKYWTTFWVFIALELLALSFKLFTRRSVPGAELAADHAIGLERAARRQTDALRGFALEGAIRVQLHDAALAALQSDALQERAFAVLSSQYAAIAPLQAAQQVMQSIANGSQDAQALMRERPEAAGLIADVWHQAIADAARAVRFGQPQVAEPPRFHA